MFNIDGKVRLGEEKRQFGLGVEATNNLRAHLINMVVLLDSVKDPHD